MFIRVELEAVGNFAIGEFGDALPSFRIPEFDESVVGAG